MKILTGKRAIVAAGVLATLGLAGCGSSASPTSQNVSAGAPAPQSTSSPNMTGAGAPFGPGCSAVPSGPANPGSFDGMSKAPVATAASNNPVLSTLVKAVTAANLGDTLNNADDITVFAPYNGAFEKVPQDTLNSLLADKDQLTKVLTYHVVQGKLSPDQLAGTHKTLEGSDLTVSGSGEDFTVNGSAKVICGNVQTANATVYIIDGVLMPKS
jgi:uncharacterized surface protein with fasciclin (FAS1) repeats